MSEMARPRADRTPPARGTRTVRIPNSSARAQACIPPAPPKASRANSRGSSPRSTLMMRSARVISAFATRTEGLLREFAPQYDFTSELRAVGEVAEEEVGVGHRGLIAAHIVGGGTRLGTSRVGTDTQRAAGVGPGYRAAARADRMDVDHGEFYGDSCDHRLRGGLGFAGQDRGGVRARTAHVEGKEVRVTAEGSHIGRADYASRGTREDTASGVGDGIFHAGYSARGLHYERRWSPGFVYLLCQPTQVGGELRRQVSVGGGRGEALELAELG